MTLSNTIKFVVVAAVLAVTSTVAQAGEPKMYLINPGHDRCPHDRLPTLGFYGYQTCHGMVVRDVVRGTEAWRIGLERGDVILSIDGIRLHDDGDYEFALRRSGHHAKLRVKDVRGRGVFTITAHLHDNDTVLRSRR